MRSIWRAAGLLSLAMSFVLTCLVGCSGSGPKGSSVSTQAPPASLAAPTGLLASPDASANYHVDLSWLGYPDSSIDGFRLFMQVNGSTSVDVTGSQLISPSATSTMIPLDSAVPEGVDLTFSLEAVKGTVVSPVDAVHYWLGFRTPPAPSVAASGGAATLSWPSLTTTASVLLIYRSNVFSGEAPTNAPIAVLPITATTFLDSGLAPGLYSYRICVATDAAASGGASSLPTRVVLPPSAGTLFQASTWQMPSGNAVRDPLGLWTVLGYGFAGGGPATESLYLGLDPLEPWPLPAMVMQSTDPYYSGTYSVGPDGRPSFVARTIYSPQVGEGVVLHQYSEQGWVNSLIGTQFYPDATRGFPLAYASDGSARVLLELPISDLLVDCMVGSNASGEWVQKDIGRFLPGQVADPSIACGINGSPMILTKCATGSGYQITLRVNNSGGGWLSYQLPEPITLGLDTPFVPPSFFQKPDGSIEIYYFNTPDGSNSSSDFCLRHVELAPDGTWSAPETIVDSLNSGNYQVCNTRVAYDPGTGNLLVGYVHQSVQNGISTNPILILRDPQGNQTITDFGNYLEALPNGFDAIGFTTSGHVYAMFGYDAQPPVNLQGPQIRNELYFESQ